MLHQRGPLQDKVFFRILKTKSSDASDICEKLKHNVKNISVLSDDTLCVLCQHVKDILVEAQKVYTSTSNNKRRYVKEYTLTVKLIRTITALALEIILQRTFIPNVLLQSVMILHSVILPNIKDEQVQDEISCFLEKWYMLDMIWKQKVIINVLKYLIKSCDTSLQHIKRLYEIKSAIILLKSTEDMQEVLKLVQKKTVMSLEEGRMLVLYLFTLGEQYILGIHNNVKVVIQNTGHRFITGYADLYATAWINATSKLKKIITESCLQDIIFHCFRAYRDSMGRGKLGKNLLTFLAAIYNNKNPAVKKVIYNQCKVILWKHLKAPGSYVRCNSAEILFVINPVQYTNSAKTRNNTHLRKYYKAITDLLKDSNTQVCILTMNGIFEILKKYWDKIPSTVIREWLNILLKCTKTSNSVEIRLEVFVGLKRIISNDNSHATLRNFLPNFANSIYDTDISVVEALIELLWHAQTYAAIPFWEIVPLTYILDRLETTNDKTLLQELVKLIWLRKFSNDIENRKTEEVTHIGINNINAVRRLCFHSSSVLNLNTSLKLSSSILSAIDIDLDRLPTTQKSKRNRYKRVKTNNKKNELNNAEDTTYYEDEDFDEYRNVHISIDVIAMLLIANAKNLNVNKLNSEEKDIMLEIAHSVPKLLRYFKDTSVNESIVFLLSLIPPTLFSDEITIIEMLIKQLCDPDVSDDMLLTVLYVLMKWEKGETVLFALTNLFTESVNVTSEHNSNNNRNVPQVKEDGLHLSLRILNHLLHAEYQTILINRYHQDVLKLWNTLYIVQSIIEKKLQEKRILNNSHSEELIVEFFNKYVSMIPMLHKKDVFDASEHFSEILLWIKRVIIAHVPEVGDAEKYQTPICIIKNVFDIANLLLKEYRCTPKLCCDIVLLYCNCISPSGGIVFMNNVFEAIMIVLDFSKVAYDNGETSLLSIIVPNFLCAVMVTSTRCPEDILNKYTNNLKMLSGITQKYFSVIENTFNSREMYLSYTTLMFNTAVSSISTGVTRVLQNVSVTAENILFTTYPYLAEKILQIILRTKKHQELTIHVLTKTIMSYTKIDMLSALLVIYRILQSSNKPPTNRLKNITLAIKLYNQRQSENTPFERSTAKAMGVVIEAILQQ